MRVFWDPSSAVASLALLHDALLALKLEAVVASCGNDRREVSQESPHTSKTREKESRRTKAALVVDASRVRVGRALVRAAVRLARGGIPSSRRVWMLGLDGDGEQSDSSKR